MIRQLVCPRATYQIHRKSRKEAVGTFKKVPFIADLHRRVCAEFSAKTQSVTDGGMAQLWGGLMCGFFLCLRISELLSLRPPDIKEAPGAETHVLSILIRQSKTDREKAGIARMLCADGNVLCPVTAMRRFLSSHRSIGGAYEPHVPFSFRRKLVMVTMWGALGNGIPISGANTHALRAGGATALFPAGADWITMQ